MASAMTNIDKSIVQYSMMNVHSEYPIIPFEIKFNIDVTKVYDSVHTYDSHL